MRTSQTEEDRGVSPKSTTAFKTEPLAKEQIMPDSTCPDWCTTTPAPAIISSLIVRVLS